MPGQGGSYQKHKEVVVRGMPRSPAWMFEWKLLLLPAQCQSPIGLWTMLLRLLMWLWHLQQPQLQQHRFLKTRGVVNQLLYRYDLCPQQDRSRFFRTSLPLREVTEPFQMSELQKHETHHSCPVGHSLLLAFASETGFCQMGDT